MLSFYRNRRTYSSGARRHPAVLLSDLPHSWLPSKAINLKQGAEQEQVHAA